MVQALTVHGRYQRGLAKLRDLDAEPAQELLSALRDIPSTVNSYSVAAAVADEVDTLAASDVEEIVPALLHVHSIRDVSGLPVSDLAEGVARGMEEASSEEIRSSPEARGAFRARLTEVLGIESLRIIARGAGLLLEHEHSATQTRIVTDIRPIFDQENPKAPPAGAMVVHTLKIGYMTDGEEKSFFVALDASDARELSEQLERANSKAESLRAVLKAAQVPYVDSE